MKVTGKKSKKKDMSVREQTITPEENIVEPEKETTPDLTEVIPVPEVEVVQPEIKEEKKREPRVRKTKKEKCVYRVLRATPNYFIASKDGEIVRFDEKNNYHKGEDVFI